MVFIFPLMMLVLYGFGIRYDVKSVPTDRVRSGRKRRKPPVHRTILAVAILSNHAIRRKLRRTPSTTSIAATARIGIVVPPNFGERLSSNRETTVQVIVDGADNNTATIALSYVSSITREYSSNIMMTQMEAMLRRTNLSVPPIEVEPRIWFNPDLESVQLHRAGNHRNHHDDHRNGAHGGDDRQGKGTGNDRTDGLVTDQTLRTDAGQGHSLCGAGLSRFSADHCCPAI